MRTLLNRLLNILLPERENHQIVRELNNLIATPIIINVNGLSVYCLFKFKNNKIRACIHEAKFHDNLKAQELLGKALYEFLQANTDVYDLIIPLPLSTKRFKERGYNQVEKILKTAKIDFNSKIIRRDDRPSQTSLTREERLGNVLGAFSVATEKAPIITGCKILLIDDVVTTGATLSAAKASLLPHQPASITYLALAH